MRGVLSIFLFLIFCVPAISQEKIDLTGTWKGSTYIEEADLELVFTLVIKYDNGKITGHFTDDMGYIDSPISDQKLENNIFTFKVVAQIPDGEITLSFRMTVTGDEMKGEWEGVDYPAFGTWNAKREKPVKINLTGTWIGPTNIPDQGDDITTWKIVQKGNKITGTVTDEFGYLNNAVFKNVKLDKDKLTFEVTASTPDGDETVRVIGTVKGDVIEGTWEILDSVDAGTWKAERKKEEKLDIKGTWKGPAIPETPSKENVLTLVLEDKEGKLTGRVSDELGYIDNVPLKNIVFDKGVLTFEIEVSNPETVYTIKFKMNVKGDSMEGDFYVVEKGSGGTWKAKKVK